MADTALLAIGMAVGPLVLGIIIVFLEALKLESRLPLAWGVLRQGVRNWLNLTDAGASAVEQAPVAGQ